MARFFYSSGAWMIGCWTMRGLETLILIKTPDDWKIGHSHTAGRARRPGQ